jgi:CubicO group peptidase (beta-lactamase class C family)
MNSDDLAQFDAEIDAYAAANRPFLNSVLVLHCGTTISEHYWRGFSATSYQPIFSVTKSVVSALVGLALGDGKLTLCDTLAQWFPEAEFAARSYAPSVTVKYLLTMTAGFRKLTGRIASSDAIPVLLKRESAFMPGEQFQYSNEDVDLLVALLERAMGESAIEYAYRRLFMPLGIWCGIPKSGRKRLWKVDRQGRAKGGHGLHLTTVELALFGQLYLQGGKWQGEQLLPADFVAASTTAQVTGSYPEFVKYGYLWWITSDNQGRRTFFASGMGGQYVYVHPALDMVVVMTSTSKANGRPRRVMVVKMAMRLIESGSHERAE